jgi:ABC-2 type transport system ATP-binding protein
VLLSSHVLSEVDQTADRIVMIGNGQAVANGLIVQLLASHRSLVRGPDMQALAHVLMRAGVRVEPSPDGQIIADAASERVSDIVFAAGVRVYGIADHRQDLEELFFRLSGGGQ